MENGKSRYKGKSFLVKSIKCVGINLNSNLDLQYEINAIGRKCEKPIKIVNCVKHTWCGRRRML
jgi:hypothetical protein